jgi:exportin-7
VASLQPYVVVSMVQLLCRTIKLGWFDSDANKNIADDCKSLLEGSSSAHFHLGLKILNTLVAEMNQPGSSRTLTQVRAAPAAVAE